MSFRLFLVAATMALFLSGLLQAKVRTGDRSPRNHASPSAAHSVTNDPANTFNLQDYGSVGNGVTDDGPALQRALDAAANAGGGTVYVPAGRYAIVTPVAKDFSNIPAARVTIQGVESSTPINVDGNGLALTAGLDLTSEFVIKTGETAKALSLSGLESLLIKDLLFIGTYENLSDALVTLSLSDINDATIRHSEFYGLASFVRSGAIILATRSRLKVTETPFLGCTVGSGYNSSVVQNIGWKNISITDTVFADYGLRPGFYGKTTWGAVYSWIGIGNAAGVDNLSPRREAFIEHVFLDEGHIFGIASRPDLYPASGSSPIDLIYISRLRMNVNNLGFAGLYLFRANSVFVGESYFGWSHNAAAALVISDVGEALLDKLECVAAANTIYADASTGRLTVINSIYEHLASSAHTTLVINTATEGEDPAQYVAQQFKDELEREPDAAAHVYWTKQLLSCDGDSGCVDERRIALASYLGGAPSPTFSITGLVKNAAGAGLSGVAVALSGSQAVNTYTDNSGAYTFAGLPTSGRYVITPAKKHYTFNPVEKNFTTPNADRIADFTAVLNTHVINGIITTGGSPLSGVTVTMSGGQTSTATTNNLGAYSFTVNAGGNYTLTPTKTHYTFTPTVRTLTDLSANTTVNFGAQLNKHRISGRVLNTSGEGLADATIVLAGSQSVTAQSGSDGTYSFDNLDAGRNYTVTASKANYALTPVSRIFNNLGSNQTGDFTGTLVRYGISGRVTTSSNGTITGLGGVSLTLGGSRTDTALTDANGNYSFADLLAEGNYTITPSKKHYHFAPETKSFNNLSAAQVADFTAVLNTHVINGIITAGGSPLSGTVKMSGGETRMVTTNNLGAYSFTVNAGGNYTLTPTQTHYTFTPTVTTLTDLSANTTVNFGAELNKHRISGRVLNTSGEGLAGATIVLAGSQSVTAQSGSDGTYSFDNLDAGRNYTVTASKANYALTPVSRIFNNLGSNQTGDFTALVLYGISGRVTTNSNGTITGLGGVSLTLGGSRSDTALTDANGNYSFADLLEKDNYTITPSKKHYHFAPATKSFNNLSAAQVADFTAVLNTHVINGIITAGGSPLSGVTVTMSGGQTSTATTNNLGAYSFTVNAGGNYTLTPTKTHYTLTPTVSTTSGLSTDETFNFATPLSFIQFSALSYSVNEEEGSATIGVTRTFDTSSQARVLFMTGDTADATQSRDYTMARGVLNFAPGETSKTFTVLITENAYVQGTHTLSLQLTNLTGGAFSGKPFSVTLTINDNDTAAPTTNPTDNARSFVRQHYADFLNREPDQAGWDYWAEQIAMCGANEVCVRQRRIGVSAAFFIEQEFQQTGFLIYRLNSATLGQIPSYTHFMTERSRLQGGVQFVENMRDYARQFVQGEEFIQAYPDSMAPADFVNKLFTTARLTESSFDTVRQQAIQALQDERKTRAEVLLEVIELPAFKARELNAAFVLMQYYGYLRRDPDPGGYLFWLNILNSKASQDGSGYRAMVCAFITSAEYQDRFSPIRTHTDQECGP